MSRKGQNEANYQEGFTKEGCSPARRLCLGREGWKFSAEEDEERKIKETEKRTQAENPKDRAPATL